MKARPSAWCGWVLLAAAACADGAGDGASPQLHEVRRYGLDAVPEGVEARVRDVGGGVLADVAGITTDADANVYVLDRDWKKIGVFSPDGSFQGVILGGAGEGPGEFELPVHLTSTSDGLLSVLDYELRRLSLFEGGELRETVPLRGSGLLRHVVLEDAIMATGHGGGSGPIARLFTREGVQLQSVPSQEVGDQPFGAPVGIARGHRTGVLVSTRRPGVWMQLDEGRWSRVGQPLFPDMEPPVEEVVEPGMMRVTPARADAGSIAETGSGHILQGYFRFDRPFTWEDPPGRDERGHYLAVFVPDGQHIGTIPLPDGVDASCLYTDPNKARIFLCARDPFPQVVEYEMEM